MNWQPPAANLNHIKELLANSSSADNEVLRQVHKELENLITTVPEYPCYLVYILTESSNPQTEFRCIAGYGLKQYLKLYHHGLRPEILQYIQQTCLNALLDPSKGIRDVVGTLISTIMAMVKPQGWPDCLPK